MPALNNPTALPTDTEQEKATLAAIKTSGNGYFVEQSTRPQTVGYALLGSPAALAAWMVDHDTDAYPRSRGAFNDYKPSGNLTRDHILDNVTTYWLTGTGASAARSYWEAYGPDAPAAGQVPLTASSIPFGFTTFPGEIWRTPRSWVEASYPKVLHFNEGEKGGPLRRVGGARALQQGDAFDVSVTALDTRRQEIPYELQRVAINAVSRIPSIALFSAASP